MASSRSFETIARFAREREAMGYTVEIIAQANGTYRARYTK
jgi:hypothetical protein